MNAKKFSDALSELDDRYVDEALHYKKKTKKSGWIPWGAVAACLCLAVLVFAARVFSPVDAMAVTAYASAVDTEITSAGAAFTTGTIL